MKRRDKTGGKAVRARRYKTLTLKRGDAQKAPRRRHSLKGGKETDVARLTRELKEERERQIATAEILRVIRTSPSDAQPVFETIVRNAVSLCGGLFANVFRFDGELLHYVASHNVGPSYADMIRAKYPMRPDSSQVSGRVVLTKSVVWLEDALTDPDYDQRFPVAMGWRRLLGVPMLREGDPIGVIGVGWAEPGPASKVEEELLKTFADQAVIAIENTRLLNELRESLQQQTATADVLKVISRSTFNLQAVLDTLVESAVRLCEADSGILRTHEGDIYPVAATYHLTEQQRDRFTRYPTKPGRGSLFGRAILEGRTIHMPDVLADPEYDRSRLQDLVTVRAGLAVPMMREGIVVGVVTLQRREPRPFSNKQIELVTTFADQAVIAIENVRLFDEVQARTRDLSEALEQQTATSEVLEVISSSPGELEPVFQAMLANAVRICEAKFGVLFRYHGSEFFAAAWVGVPPAYEEDPRRRGSFRPEVGVPLDRLLKTKELIHTADELAEPNSPSPAAKFGGARSLIAVPMFKDNDLVGAIVIYRQEVRPFSDRQIELVKNFAAQAVIAIENTRLLNELRESLQQQTATADVLKVISRSTFDLRTVLQTLVESAARLCDADKTVITREQNGAFYRAEAYGFSREFMDYVRDIPIKAERGSAFGRSLLESRVVHIPDVKADPEYTWVEAQRLGDYRTVLTVPMLREGVAIGVLSLTRSEVRPFTDKQIELATTFADQAAIAIENVRLFESVEARTRELAASLENLRTTQDRLVQTQKLASLGQLTAGIAHEIKNPLNFVNNFSGVSAELIDELQATLKNIPFDDKARAEINELTDTLQDNLDKVMQHGKRADAIVKNMLLHSRESSGEHRRVEINAIVEESLNLAYHGARAEKQGFNITIERSFDPAAGAADVFPQDITRALLNLISNGFYAATKRKVEADGDGYEPTLAASTRSLGDWVEIRIRDNGAGIPPDVKEKMFNPFFTTKPAGEGTGLGLSISHDIIVKQHAGSIAVDTEPGEFTEISVTLPRAASFVAKSGKRA